MAQLLPWQEMEVVSTLKTLLSNASLTNESAGKQPLDNDTYHNLLNEFRETLFTHREFKTIVLICLYVPIFLMSFVGNVTVLLVVLLHKHMRSVTNCFIVNLALADVLVTVVCVPMAIGQGVYRLWVYGEFMCKLTSYMQGVTVAASIFTLMALSVDRFLAIRHPMTFRRISSGSHAWKISLVIWLIAFCIMVPLLLVRKLNVIDMLPSEPLYFCNEVWNHIKHRQIYDVFLFVIMFVLPGYFIAFSYALIGKQLCTEGVHFNRSDSKVSRIQVEKVMSGRRRVARMLIVLAIVFALCWMPYHLLSLFLAFQPRGNGALETLPFAILLGHSNSAFNPVLYCFMNKSFRHCALRMMHCKKGSKKRKKKCPRQETPVNGPMKTSVNFSRRPIRRLFSSSSATTRSTSGSLRFSRSSNTSLKTKHTMIGQETPRVMEPKKNPPVITIEQPSSRESMHASDAVYPSLNIQTHDESAGWGSQRAATVRQRREMFNHRLSIPTTINEESSRSSRTPSPSAEKANPLKSLTEESDGAVSHRTEIERSSCLDTMEQAFNAAPSELIYVNVHDTTPFEPFLDSNLNSVPPPAIEVPHVETDERNMDTLIENGPIIPLIITTTEPNEYCVQNNGL